MTFEFVAQALEQRASQGLKRQRHMLTSSQGVMLEADGQHYLNFSSNDYLGMRQSSAVIQGYADGLGVYGVGSGAAPLVTGYTNAHQALEEYIAEGTGREAALLFNSGFSANQAVCQALGNDGVHLVADKLIHASFIDGAMASDATFKRFRHNDTDHLSQLLNKIDGDIIVATEGIFSMDGDAAPLTEIASLTGQKQAWLMVDDAHGFGVLGDNGLGSAEHYGLSQQQLPLLMGTFGKAIGTSGAFIAGSRQLIEYLVNFARHYVYSTAMPPAQAYATLQSLRALKDSERRDQLRLNIESFKQKARQAGLTLLPSDSAIQPVLVGNPETAVALSDSLKTLGIWVTAMRAPTVPKGTDRLRVTLSAAHQENDIAALVDALSIVFSRHTDV